MKLSDSKINEMMEKTLLKKGISQSDWYILKESTEYSHWI